MASADPQTKVRVAITCPRCNRHLERINRKKIDKVIGFLITVRRYKCMGCFWEGWKVYQSND